MAFSCKSGLRRQTTKNVRASKQTGPRVYMEVLNLHKTRFHILEGQAQNQILSGSKSTDRKYPSICYPIDPKKFDFSQISMTMPPIHFQGLKMAFTCLPPSMSIPEAPYGRVKRFQTPGEPF